MKKIIIILIALILISLLVIGGISLLKGDENTTSQNTEEGSGITLRDFFPFGGVRDTPTENEVPVPVENPTGTDTPTIETPKASLQQITTASVAGFGFGTNKVLLNPEELSNETIITVTPTFTFTKELKLETKSEDVRELQKLLNQCPATLVSESGPGSIGKETDLFRPKTEAAVKKFQEKFAIDILAPQNLSAPTGIVDEKTREKLNNPFECDRIKEASATITKPVVRYMERSNGNVYETVLGELDIQKITITTIPRVHEAFFIDNGNSVVARYIKPSTNKIQSFLGTIPEHTRGIEQTNKELKGSFLAESISSVTYSPDTKRIFYLSPFNGGIAGDILTPQTLKKTSLYVSAFSEWNSKWVSDTYVLLTTKPASTVGGYSFLLNTETKSLTKVLGNITGLTTIANSDTSKIVYSTSLNGKLALYVFDKEKNQSFSLSKTTIPDKCVWKTKIELYCAIPTAIKAGEYPDLWYQGLVSFTDELYLLNVETNSATLITRPVDSNKNDMDMIKLALSPDGEYLFFVNKKDSTLWSLDLVP